MVPTHRIDGTLIPATLMEYINTVHDLRERTKKDYAQKMQSILRQCSKKYGVPNLTPEVIVRHLNELVSTQSAAQSTLRSLKAASRFWLAEEAQKVIHQDEGNLKKYEDAFQALRTLKITSLSKQSLQTSGTKLKYFPEEMLNSVMHYNEKYASIAPNSGTLIAFLKANLLVGLRPAEWFSTTFISYLHRDTNGHYQRDHQGRLLATPAMVVDNAKATFGRGNGERRELILYGISKEELTTLCHFSEIIRSFASKYPPDTPSEKLAASFYKPLQHTLTRALLREGHSRGTLPSTYSTRHQAIADAKSSKLSDKEIAAMFGHITPRTAKRHYGNKHHGQRKVTFRPSPESLSVVLARELIPNNAIPAERTVQATSEWYQNIQNRQPQTTPASLEK